MIASDARVLWQLLRGHPKTGDHAADLSGFYGGQAEAYDAFRERLLPGRQQLYAELAQGLPANAHLVELGAGTGRNLAWLGGQTYALGRADLVDLCQPLLAQAEKRWQAADNVSCHLADASTWQPEAPVDAVVFAYSLTMIPDWQAAIANAIKMLKPGGQLAIVDFTITPEQSKLARWFWQRWFAHDGVHLNLEHLPTLSASLPQNRWQLSQSHLPYLPGLRICHYRFIASKP